MIDVDVVAQAFALDQPIGPLVSIRERGQVLAWRVETGSGPVLVKRFWAEDNLPWRNQLESALDLERRAVEAGIDTPQAIPPVRPFFGTVARIDGMGLFRAFPYIEHRQLEEADDISEWLGATLARTHQLRSLDHDPEPNWWYCQFPPVPPEQWEEWLRAGQRRGTSWAPLLGQHLDLVLELAGQVVETFATSEPHVFSHRDVEPWNVLLSENRPVLIDWDTSGPESASLEAAYAFTVFAKRGRADPDPNQVRAAHAAYVAAGGNPLVQRPGMLDRLVGIQLSKLASALGQFFDVPETEERIQTRLERLPASVANIRRWEQADFWR